MQSKYYKNNIICGPLDAYCLLCENYMRSEDDIQAHILKPVHKKNLDQTPYCEKYKDDHVRKVKRGYYCELCNLLFSTIIKVRLHVTEVQHNTNKISQTWRRINGGVVVFEQIFLSDEAWNGFIDGTCFICNEDFQEANIHKSEDDHILKLIDSKIEFVDNSVYRETTHGYQCMTCNKKIELGDNSIIEHFEHPHHRSNSDKSADYLMETFITTTNKYEFNENNKPEAIKLDDNVEKQTKVDNSESVVRVDSATIKTAIVNNITDTHEQHIMDTHDPLGRVNYIQENDKNNTLRCVLCDWVVGEATVDLHVNSKHHKTLARMHKDRIEKMFPPKKDTKEGNSQMNNAEVDNPKSQILDSLTEFQNNDININFENGTAVCRQCSKNLIFTFDDIKSHIEEHTNQLKKEEKQAPSIPFKANNTGTFSVKKGMLYTAPVLIEKHKEDQAERDVVSVSSQNQEETTSDDLKERIENVTHGSRTKRTDKNGENINLKRIKMGQFFRAYFSLMHVESGFQYMALEDKFSVPEDSFFMIVLNSLQSYTCHFCEISFNVKERADHLNTTKHLEAMNNVRYIISFDSEFVREIRSGVFHCGFCNTIELDLDSLKKHLNTTHHRETKQYLNWHLLRSKNLIQKNMSIVMLSSQNLTSYCKSMLN